MLLMIMRGIFYPLMSFLVPVPKTQREKRCGQFQGRKRKSLLQQQLQPFSRWPVFLSIKNILVSDSSPFKRVTGKERDHCHPTLRGQTTRSRNSFIPLMTWNSSTGPKAVRVKGRRSCLWGKRRPALTDRDGKTAQTLQVKTRGVWESIEERPPAKWVFLPGLTGLLSLLGWEKPPRLILHNQSKNAPISCDSLTRKIQQGG